MDKHPLLYRYSQEEAERCNERGLWRASLKANIQCSMDIEHAMRHFSDAQNIPGDAAENLIALHGLDRLNWVLASTMRKSNDLPGYSEQNRAWAKSLEIPDHFSSAFFVNLHPTMVNALADQAQRHQKGLGLFGNHSCGENLHTQDFKDRVLVLKPGVLKDQYRHPEYQLFFAASGFGCNPDASGRKVYGQFLFDGEKCCFNRSDFFGILKDSETPDWAREKLQALQGNQDQNDTGEAQTPQSGMKLE